MIGNPRKAYITNSGEIWYKSGDSYVSEARRMKLPPKYMRNFLLVYGGGKMEEAERVEYNFRKIAETNEENLYKELRSEEGALERALNNVRNLYLIHLLLLTYQQDLPRNHTYIP